MSWARIGREGDRLLPFALAAAALLEVLLVHPDYDRRIFVPLALLVPLTLRWRRRFPLAVLPLNMAAWFVIDLQSPVNEDPLALAITLAVAVYSVGAHTEGMRMWIGAALVASLAVTGTIADADEGTLLDFLGNATFFFTIFGGLWLAGRAIRRRGARERELIVEREEGARAAVMEERTRIARELHDVVAHGISVIVLQARGARHALTKEPEDARRAVDAIERTASQALVEMRRLLAILRDDDTATLAPQPSLDHLDLLVEHVRGAGLPVQVEVEGTPRELSPGIDASAYRIVQEALTNALKHAGPSRAKVTVRWGADTLELEVADDGAGSGNGAGGGHGLIGMRERAALFGGDVEAGRRADGGYAVLARLPL